MSFFQNIKNALSGLRTKDEESSDSKNSNNNGKVLRMEHREQDNEEVLHMEHRELLHLKHRTPNFISKEEFLANNELRSSYIRLCKPFVQPSGRKIRMLDDYSNRRVSNEVTDIPEEYRRMYEQRANRIAEGICHIENTTYGKIKRLFDFFRDQFFYWNSYPQNEREAPEPRPFRGIPNSDYNTKEGAILGGYSICGGLSCAFADICNRMGIDCEVVGNGKHGWNMFFTDQGPLFIDISPVVKHIIGNDPLAAETISSASFSSSIPDPMVFFLRKLDDLPDRPYGHSDMEMIDECKKILIQAHENNNRSEI